MEPEEEEFVCPPAGNTEGAGEDEFTVAPPEVVPRSRAVGHTGRPREEPRTGTFGAWLVQQGVEDRRSSSAASSSELPAEFPSIVGLSCCR